MLLSKNKSRRNSIALLFLLSSAAHSQSQVPASSNPDHVTIRSRTVTLVRPSSLIKGFPEKRTAKVTYPVISGPLKPAVLQRVQSLLNVKHIFDSSLEEYRQEAWLEEFGYEVNYNRNYILDITFTQSGSGAYPDIHTRHFAIDLRGGSVIKASEVFVADKQPELAGMVNRKLQAELKKIVESLTESNSDPEDLRIAKEAQEPLEFRAENLGDFSVGATGITFLYDAGYPHAIQAFEPEGTYFFSYSDLKPFIKRESVLGQFVK